MKKAIAISAVFLIASLVADSITDNHTMAQNNNLTDRVYIYLNNTIRNLTMDGDEADWISEPKVGEIEEAEHGLDFVHLDFSMTGNPLLCLVIIISITMLKPTLEWRYINKVPESVMLMAYGLVIACPMFYGFNISWKLEPQIFFIFLLPPIVNDAGLSMQRREVFQNIGKISLFAGMGTILSTGLTALSLHYLFSSFFQFQASFLVFLMFSAIISAVDPVSVLSTMSVLEVKNSLYVLIFGESLLNDAVTIVLYRTSFTTVKAMDVRFDLDYVHLILVFIGQFLYVSLGGLVIGLIGGFIGVFVTKKFFDHQMLLPMIQLVFPVFYYLIAESFHLSGILALVTASMIFSYYMKANVCVEMELVTFTVSKTMSSLSESIIFFYLGLSMISETHQYDWIFISSVIVTCTLVRLIVITSLSSITNLFLKKNQRLPFNDQLFITHAGIRGAVCFGLVQSIDERVVPIKDFLVTCTLAMIVFTSFAQGCTVKFVLECLNIAKTDDDDSVPSSPSKMAKAFKKFDKKLLSPLLKSETTYAHHDATFTNLKLPKNVSTALRIGERSHIDLHKSISYDAKPRPIEGISVPRPTASPFGVEFNIEDNTIIPPAPVSAGRRTPLQRGSIYSRHFLPPVNWQGDEDQSNLNYLSLQQPKGQKRRPAFNQYDTYHCNSIDVAMAKKKRHNSMGPDDMRRPSRHADITEHSDEHLHAEEPVQKKISRTVISGKKTFVVDVDDLNSIHEDTHSAKTLSDEKLSKHSKASY